MIDKLANGNKYQKKKKNKVWKCSSKKTSKHKKPDSLKSYAVTQHCWTKPMFWKYKTLQNSIHFSFLVFGDKNAVPFHLWWKENYAIRSKSFKIFCNSLSGKATPCFSKNA